jgi:hypothetical protein
MKQKIPYCPKLADKINIWCEILEKKAKVQTYGPQNIYFWFSVGNSYYKIIMTYQDTKENSVHAFLNKKTGDIYKPATWSAPYKQVRYNIWTQFDKLLNDCDWVGRYLYKQR